MTAFFFYFKIRVVIEMNKQVIDPVLTGKNLKKYVEQSGYSVKEIQNYLCLECPQPIYRWFKGKTLPSIHHLYSLSLLLNISMNDLIETKNQMIEWGYFVYDIKKGNLILEKQEIF